MDNSLDTCLIIEGIRKSPNEYIFKLSNNNYDLIKSFKLNDIKNHNLIERIELHSGGQCITEYTGYNSVGYNEYNSVGYNEYNSFEYNIFGGMCELKYFPLFLVDVHEILLKVYLNDSNDLNNLSMEVLYEKCLTNDKLGYYSNYYNSEKGTSYKISNKCKADNLLTISLGTAVCKYSF